jgi:hypothetical protein
MSALLALAVMLSCACSSRVVPPPLDKRIVGTWDELCQASGREITECTGKDDNSGFMEFSADGGWRADGGHELPPITGTWTLRDGRLEVFFVLGGKPATDAYRVHLEGDQLTLSGVSIHFTTIYTRRGTRPALASSAVTTGRPVTSTLSGVTYTLPLPAGYRLASDESYRQLWSRTGGQGIMVEVRVRGHHTGDPCAVEPRPLSERGMIGGVERETKIYVYLCAHDIDATCMVKHARGYLETDEVAAGNALCAAMSLR